MSKLRGKKVANRLQERRNAASNGPSTHMPGSQNPHKGRSGVTRTSSNSAKLRSQAATR